MSINFNVEAMAEALLIWAKEDPSDPPHWQHLHNVTKSVLMDRARSLVAIYEKLTKAEPLIPPLPPGPSVPFDWRVPEGTVRDAICQLQIMSLVAMAQAMNYRLTREQAREIHRYLHDVAFDDVSILRATLRQCFRVDRTSGECLYRSPEMTGAPDEIRQR